MCNQKTIKITSEMREDLIELLSTLSSVWYDDSNGPWGYECPACFGRSTDGKSPPEHKEDCLLIKVLNQLYKLEDVLDKS